MLRNIRQNLSQVMVDHFDPNLLRFDLLRRVAQSQVPRGNMWILMGA